MSSQILLIVKDIEKVKERKDVEILRTLVKKEGENYLMAMTTASRESFDNDDNISSYSFGDKVHPH